MTAVYVRLQSHVGPLSSRLAGTGGNGKDEFTRARAVHNVLHPHIVDVCKLGTVRTTCHSQPLAQATIDSVCASIHTAAMT